MAKKKLTETEYNEIIKANVENGTFFKDSMLWFYEKYVSIFTERIVSIVFLIICFFALHLMRQLLKKEIASPKSIPIVTMERDQTKYLPLVKKLVIDDVARTVDETMLRELLKDYLHYHEDFNYQSGSIVAYNNQLNRIKNNSSVKVFLDFKKKMDPNNPDSPMRYFGKKFKRENEILSFEFIRNEPEDLISRFRLFIDPSNEISNKAVIIFNQYEITTETKRTIKYRAEIVYNFTGIRKTQDNSTFIPMKFSVIEYVLIPLE